MESGTTILDCQVDRLSNLPDDLIYKILSYVDIKYCIKLSVLSSRWRFIHASMPNLKFSSDRKTSGYHKFVKHVLSARNNKIDVSSINMHLRTRENPEFSVNRILKYAFSHNVQQLTINVEYYATPPSWLISKSLKHLTLIATTIDGGFDSLPWDLPALTTLHLHHVRLYNCSSLLAMCQNLKNLTLEGCEMYVHEYDDDGYPTFSKGFTIINSQLRSLTLKKVEWNVGVVYVDTPQLKSLILLDKRKFSGKLTISARDLTYLRIKGTNFPKLSLDGCPSLEKVDLCISYPKKKNVHRISDVFQCLHSVKSLALSLEIVELLSTSEEVISHQPSPFPSLQSLKIYPLQGLKTLDVPSLTTCQLKSSLKIFQTQPDVEQEAMKIKLSAEVTNYLLGSSSNVTFTMVSHEEARAIKITKVAYRLMAALWEILEEREAYTDTKRANVEWKKTLADSYCEDFKRQIGPPQIFRILHNIKLLLAKVLASKRVEMQARFSRLYTKTKTIVDKMIVDMKDFCDIQQRFFSGYLDEIALSS
ncbi:F-box domain, Leucine-rich repeat domain, L domain-like protein [Artemisia annua]|uniref:F-box domain, Leucine-rich repeat domain, L domain-like protein n=1 Tax=Artemisia annua TaxID=35608 RepID=A0A2U1PJD6_ARTAN|nr:F-box domain, Leucine-rich repeat domain, L domain-like protein [Artemisia annua]